MEDGKEIVKRINEEIDMEFNEKWENSESLKNIQKEKEEIDKKIAELAKKIQEVKRKEEKRAESKNRYL